MTSQSTTSAPAATSEKAAAEDQPLALSLLSRMYRKGLGVAVHPKVAFDLTIRAAEAGYPVAQYEAGAALYQGDGVEIDRVQVLRGFAVHRRAESARVQLQRYQFQLKDLLLRVAAALIRLRPYVGPKTLVTLPTQAGYCQVGT